MQFLAWFRGLAPEERNVEGKALRAALNKSPPSQRRDGLAYDSWKIAQEVLPKAPSIVWGKLKVNVRGHTIGRLPPGSMNFEWAFDDMKKLFGDEYVRRLKMRLA